MIDTTIIRDGDIYYRFHKDETSKQITLDKGTDLEGAFVRSPFYRNMFSVTPNSKGREVAAMLKAHVQESKEAAREKAKAVATRLREMKLKEAAEKLENGIEEMFAYMDFPGEHWNVSAQTTASSASCARYAEERGL